MSGIRISIYTQCVVVNHEACCATSGSIRTFWVSEQENRWNLHRSCFADLLWFSSKILGFACMVMRIFPPKNIFVPRAFSTGVEVPCPRWTGTVRPSVEKGGRQWFGPAEFGGFGAQWFQTLWSSVGLLSILFLHRLTVSAKKTCDIL